VIAFCDFMINFPSTSVNVPKFEEVVIVANGKGWLFLLSNTIP
jgi:hypothetical protein